MGPTSQLDVSVGKAALFGPNIDGVVAGGGLLGLAVVEEEDRVDEVKVVEGANQLISVFAAVEGAVVTGVVVVEKPLVPFDPCLWPAVADCNAGSTAGL